MRRRTWGLGLSSAVAATLLCAPGPTPVHAAVSPPAPATAHAVIRTIALGAHGLAAAAGGAWTSSTSDDTIYVTSNSATVAVIHPVSLAVVSSIPVGNYPIGVAVNRDDTVYVVNADSDTMSVINPDTLTVSQTVNVPDEPQAVAVSRLSDDTLFISSRGTSQQITMLSARTLSGPVSTSIGSNATPHGLGLSRDDSAYIATWPNEPRYFNSTSRAVTNLTSLGTRFIGVAVSSEDTVYLTNEVSNTVKSFRTTTPGTVSSVTVASSPQGVAIGADDTVYVANRNANRMTVINPRTNQVDDSVAVGSGPYGIAATRGGLIVTADNFGTTASIVAPITPSLVITSAFAGTTGSLTLGGLPAGVTVDDTTVRFVAFDDDTVVWARTPGTNTFTGTIPPGSGSVPVVVSLNGGNRAYAGSFTYAVPPPPPTPASAPLAAIAVAGDASALVSWAAPASSGSYPVTYYQATSSPGGRTCLVAAPELTCTVSGLTNDATYTFTVRALTGAGWSAPSDPSNAVTPQAVPRATIRITGARDGRQMVVTGMTTGFGMGAELVGWVRFRGGEFERQPGRILVDADGGFTWERRTRRPAVVYVSTPDGSVVSNRVVIAAR